MRKLLKTIAVVILLVVGLLFGGGGLLAVKVLSRKRPQPVPSTTHASIRRSACVECHTPIAEEWQQSYHYKSLTGPYWKDVRQLGYLDFFERLRKSCVNCHAPANVLDLIGTTAAPVAAESQLGVECTPNVFKEPQGTIPAARSDDVELGVDCTACHVSRRGILGTGRRKTAAHETIGDQRFQVPAVTVDALCRTCHGATVEAWKKTKFAAQGITCLDCHMPEVTAPSVAGGPERVRRSHSFVADKDPAMLSKALNATLDITDARKARFQILNDRVGHDFPSGGNWVSVHFKAYDSSGRMLSEQKDAFGKDEALVLDFWPFNLDSRIASGKQKELVFSLPKGHGTVEAVVSYHDWMQAKSTIATLKRDY